MTESKMTREEAAKALRAIADASVMHSRVRERLEAAITVLSAPVPVGEVEPATHLYSPSSRSYICVNCEQPRHDHYSGPTCKPGELHCHKYTVPLWSPEAVAAAAAPIEVESAEKHSSGLLNKVIDHAHLTGRDYLMALEETRARDAAITAAAERAGYLCGIRKAHEAFAKLDLAPMFSVVVGRIFAELTQKEPHG